MNNFWDMPFSENLLAQCGHMKSTVSEDFTEPPSLCVGGGGI